jgi:hypothetical protein
LSQKKKKKKKKKKGKNGKTSVSTHVGPHVGGHVIFFQVRFFFSFKTSTSEFSVLTIQRGTGPKAYKPQPNPDTRISLSTGTDIHNWVRSGANLTFEGLQLFQF